MEKIIRLKWYYFGLVFLLSLPVSAYFLRQNNLKMIELRDAVVEVDQKSGDIKEIEPKLTELRDYVLTHMNASLPSPLELPGSFNVAVEQAQAKAEASGQVESGIYAKAQAQCERADVPLSVRAECIQNYVLTNASSASDPEQVELPPKERFTYNYVSPFWSFDIAGLATLLSFTLFVITLVKLLMNSVYPRLTKHINNQPYE